MVKAKNKKHNGLYFGDMNKLLPFILYPKKKNGKNDRVLCKDKNLLKGNSPEIMLTKKAKIKKALTCLNNLSGTNCTKDLQ